MEDKKNLTEKELLNVAGGNKATDYVRSETCNRIGNKKDCEKQKDKGCKWIDNGSNKCIYEK